MIGPLRARLRAYGRKLLAEHTAPGRLAAACVVGAMAGCTPLFGLHLPLCIALAWLLGLNKVTVYAAANISIPPTAPLLGFASVEVGERLVHGRWLAMSMTDFRHQPLLDLARRFFLDWLVGGPLVGAAIGGVMGAIVYLIARRRRALHADPLRQLVVAAARRYGAAPRRLRMYAWFKYRLDPCYRSIAPRIPAGSLTVDLGTGLGMLPVAIALGGEGRRAIGVEWDEAKLAAGRTAAQDLAGVELVAGDLRRYEIPPCDVVTLVDVIHYYEPDAQREILGRAAAALRPGGMLLVREGDAEARRGAGWTRFVEKWAVKLGWNRGEGKTRFRPVAELRADLEALGLTVTVDEVAGKLHPGNVLLEARKA